MLLKEFWNHPVGPKTVHFWAPIFKWGLVLAGIGDLQRPVEHVSLFQSTALAATGLIWSRYSTQIIPVNYSLLSVNAFVAATGIYQLWRVWSAREGTREVEACIDSVVERGKLWKGLHSYYVH